MLSYSSIALSLAVEQKLRINDFHQCISSVLCICSDVVVNAGQRCVFS